MSHTNKERLLSAVSEQVNQLDEWGANDNILISIFDVACKMDATPEDWIETMKHYHQLIHQKKGDGMYNGR